MRPIIITLASQETMPRSSIAHSMNNNGIKTAARDKVIDKMVKPISLAPSIAACNGRLPISICRTMFSSMTATVIALSGRYEEILNYVISVDFISFGLTAASLFVFRRKVADSTEKLYLAPGHPYTTGLFVLACAAIVITTVATFPANSAIGLVILLAGFPVYLYWSRNASQNPPAPNL